MREVLQAIGRERAVEFTIDPEVQGTVTTSFTNLPLKEGLRRLAGSYALLFMREPASGRESLLRVAVLQEGEAQASSSEPATSQETIRAPPKGRSRVPTFPTAKRVIGGVLREEEKDVEFAPNEVLVKLKDDAPEGAIDDVVRQLDAIILKQYGAIGYYRLELSAQTSVAEAIAELEANQLVEVVEPNYIVHVDLQPNDPSFGQLWGLHNTGQTGGAADADIDAPEAWDTQRGSTSVVVAVIDTGVDYNHPDLAANMWTNSGEVPGNGIDDDNNGYVDDYRGWDFYNNDNDPYDDHRHGTHVAGTIAAVGDNGVGVVGVNWTARIMPLKFLSGGGSGYISDAVEAVLYAAANGAKVMNNSWGGGGYSSALYSAIQTANTAGSLFIAAAGNSSNNNDATPYYPTNYNVANVVSVAASTSSDTLAYFSSYGANTVDLAAPGVGILSTVPGSGYSSFSGTSMATPHVAGAAALLMAQFPSSSHLEIRALMMDSVDPVGAFAGITITGGRLNVSTPMTCQSNTLTVSGLTPADGATIALSESMTVSARVTACGGAVSGATASAAFSTGGPALALFDDGAHNDGAAGDGLFGASWAPATEGSVSLTITASASGYTSGSASTTFNVLRIIVYQYNDAYAYQWIDATQGIDIGIQDDDTSAVVDLGFSFDFYEVAHTQVRVSSNGYLTFGNNGTRYVNDPIPSSGTPNDLIAPFWDDLNPLTGGAIYLLRSGAAPNRSVTVQWHNVPHYYNTGAVTFQVTLYEGSNEIVFRYKDVTFDNSSYDDGASATVGVEAPTGSFGTQYSTNRATLSAGKAINFYFSPPVLSVSPTGPVDFGTVAVGESADRSFTVTNTGGGTLAGTVSTASPFGIGSGDTSGLLNGLVALWPLDEESGARSDAVGESTLTDENGVGSTGGIPSGTRSARFSRANGESLSHTDSAGLSMGDIDFTIAFWVYMESKPRTEMYFVSKLNEPTDREYLIGYNDGPDRFIFAVSSDGTGAGSRAVHAGNLGSPSTGTWYFVVAWHDSVNDEIAIQVNDGPADTRSHTGGVYDGGTTFRLGARFNSPSAFLDGRMAEVGIWKRLLTDAEKTSLYNSGNGIVYPFAASSDDMENPEEGTSATSGTFRLQAGASTTVVTNFSPTVAQSYSGAISFTSNGGSASRTATGTGEPAPTLSVSPAGSVDFGSVTVGSSADQSFTVTNTGGGTLTGSVSAASPFSVVSGGSLSLGAGASATVSVRFSPTAGQAYNETISFTSNGGNLSRTVTGTGQLPPSLSVSPTGTVDFGAVTIGSSTDKSFTVTNTGGGTLTGTVSTTSPFSVVSGGSFSLVAGSSATVSVRFSPAGTGSASRTITFSSNGGSASRTATGTGEAPPVISVSPAGSVGFGTVTTGSSSSQSFTVTNTGGSTLTGTVSTTSPFSVVSGGSFSLAAGASATVSVSFSPTATGSLSRTVSFSSNGGSASRTVTGTGEAPPVISVSPAGSVDFGTVTVGGSTDQNFTVTNTGSGTLTGTVSTTSPFSVVSGGSFSLAAGASATVSVRFSPTAAGSASRTVPFTSNGGNLSRTVTGTGETAPALAVSPAGSVGFGTVTTGSSADQSFTVTNTGGGTLTGTVSTTSPFSVVSGGSFSLAAGASATVSVRFSPTAAQAYSETISFASNGGNLSRTVTGTGETAPALAVSPAGPVDFGTVTTGSSADQSFTVTNTGGGTLTGTVSTDSPFSVVAGGSSQLATDLVAYWPLDEESGARSDAVGESTLTDENGAGSTGGIPSGTRSARFSRANGESLSHTDSAGLSMGDIDFTIAFWVYMESKPATEMYFLSKWNEPTDREYIVGYNDGNDRFAFSVSSYGGGGNAVIANNLGSPSTGAWHFVVAWHDSVNDEIAIQVNDGPADTRSHTGGVYDGGTTFRLGARFNSPSAFLDGRMAEVGIWKRLLTDAEKTALYNSGNGFVYPFSGASSGGSFSLAAGASATVAVRFSPTAAQSYNGAVSFASNGGSASRTVTGTGTDAVQAISALSVSPTSPVDFGSVTGTGQAAQGTSVSTTGTVDENSLAGRWRAYTVLSGGTVEGWLKGELSIDAGGSVTGGSLTDPAGTTYSIAEGSASIDSDGYLDLALMLTDGTFSITNASTNLTRDLIVGVGSQNGNPMWFVFVKESNQISQADMEGIWYLYTAESGGDQIEEALEGHSWGWLSVGESGGIIDGAEATSGGGVFSSATGQLNLNSNDGTFTGSHTYIEGTIRTIVAASLSPQKSFAVGVGHRADGATTKYFLLVATRSEGTFEQAQVAGTWRGYRVESGPAPLPEGCSYRAVGLNSAGFVTGGSDTNCDGNTANFTSGQMTLGPEGVVTAQISSTDDFSQSKQGSMTRTKNEMVLVTHNPSEESYSLVVLMR